MKSNSKNFLTITFTDNSKPCVEFFKDYTLQNGIMTGISVGISLITNILRIIIRKVTHFEAHHTLT